MRVKVGKFLFVSFFGKQSRGDSDCPISPPVTQHFFIPFSPCVSFAVASDSYPPPGRNGTVVIEDSLFHYIGSETQPCCLKECYTFFNEIISRSFPQNTTKLYPPVDGGGPPPSFHFLGFAVVVKNLSE